MCTNSTPAPRRPPQTFRRRAAKRQRFDVKLIETFAAATYAELDYVNEGINQERFQAQVVPRMAGAVRVPAVHWTAEGGACTTRKVLVTEWVEGRQLARSDPGTIQRLVPRGVACFLCQLLDVGFFHADPHPGNLLVDREGRLCLIDFGLCARVTLPNTVAMTSALLNLMHGNAQGLMDDAAALGFLPPGTDTAPIVRDMGRILRHGNVAAEARAAPTPAAPQPPAAPPAPGGGPFVAVQRRRKRLRAISAELNRVFFEYPFQIPEYFALITRALVVLEGIALEGDPAFDIFGAAYPYAAQRAAAILQRSASARAGPEIKPLLDMD